MNRELCRLSRGELIRRICGDNSNPGSIERPILSLMKRVEGAELVRYDRGFRIGDEFHAVYYVSPEATVIKFDVEIDVKITATGITDSSITQTYERVQKALNAQSP